jgi:predicted regulator of Ras-like GTPase activity (Roadblock/LC7/MglB family)
VDAATALTELLALSTQVVEAVVVGPDGLEASSTVDPARAERLAAAG